MPVSARLSLSDPVIPLMRANVLMPYASFLQKAGSPVSRFFEQVRLSPELLEFPEELVPMHQVTSFIEVAGRAEGVENLGLVVGKTASLGSLGDFGRLMKRPGSLYEVLKTACANMSSYNSAARLWLAQLGKTAMLCHRTSVPHEMARQLALTALCLMVDIVRSVAPAGWRPDEVIVRGNGGDRRLFESFFEARVSFDPEKSAIRFDRALLTLRVPYARETSPMQNVNSAFQGSAPEFDVVGSTRQLIRSALKIGDANISAVAHSVGMSARTLERHLNRERASFSLLLDDVRFELAESMLRDPNLPIVEISFEAGYGDPANFARAFRRWSGMSPSRFRELVS